MKKFTLFLAAAFSLGLVYLSFAQSATEGGGSTVSIDTPNLGTNATSAASYLRKDVADTAVGPITMTGVFTNNSTIVGSNGTFRGTVTVIGAQSNSTINASGLVIGSNMHYIAAGITTVNTTNTLNMLGAAYQTNILTVGTTFVASNRAAGRQSSMIIVGASSNVVIAIEGANVLGTRPTTLAAGKIAVLSGVCIDSGTNGVIWGYNVVP